MSNDIVVFRRRIDPALADLRAARSAVRTEKASLTQAEKQTVASVEAQALLQEVAQAVQQTVHARVAGVVSRCLEAVWGEDAYQFRIDFRRLRGRTEADIYLERDGNRVDPMDGAGGGCCDVVSFALRLAALMLHRPKLRRLLVADEPMRHLSADRRPAARAMLHQLTKDLGFQLLLVTHSRKLACGKVVEIGE